MIGHSSASAPSGVKVRPVGPLKSAGHRCPSSHCRPLSAAVAEMLPSMGDKDSFAGGQGTPQVRRTESDALPGDKLPRGRRRHDFATIHCLNHRIRFAGRLQSGGGCQ